MPAARPPYLLPAEPIVPATIHRAVREDYERLATTGWPVGHAASLADRYGIDLATQYAGFELTNPWGKASGQLSMTARQVADDVEAGLGFVVLKTVIAQDESGAQTMGEWAIPEARMSAEPIVGASGEPGWTISWKGRGWWQSFDDYLQLVRDANQIAANSDTLIVPSCKFHLPTTDDEEWNVSEYEYTTRRLLETWCQTSSLSGAPMPLEKDFSPTLAGSDRAAAQARILEWLRRVPQLVRSAADGVGSSCRVRLGLKIFNALFDDEFQLEMLRTIHEPGPMRPDFYIYANRLFDPDRQFDGHRGIAYGGPDLSDRNLRAISKFLDEVAEPGEPDKLLPWSATGNITTGKMALEYALRGAGSFQLHTFFQLPADQYTMQRGSKVQKALHELYLHPQHGLIVWMHHIAGQLGILEQPIRFRDLIGKAGRL